MLCKPGSVDGGFAGKIRGNCGVDGHSRSFAGREILPPKD